MEIYVKCEQWARTYRVEAKCMCIIFCVPEWSSCILAGTKEPLNQLQFSAAYLKGHLS
jgi:hypothetical protein